MMWCWIYKFTSKIAVFEDCYPVVSFGSVRFYSSVIYFIESIDESSLRKLVQVTARWPLSESMSEEEAKELNRKESVDETPKTTLTPTPAALPSSSEDKLRLLDRFKDLIKNILFQ